MRVEGPLNPHRSAFNFLCCFDQFPKLGVLQAGLIASIGFDVRKWQTYIVSTMKKKHLTSRDLRRGTPEESLAPGESVLIKKNRGKVFELTRVDAGTKSINRRLDDLLTEMPPTGARVRANLARIIIEDRE